ncbi:MAG: hypothetical protein FJ288_05875 [Planctomycetes bacterium]|nr:hypothetical protein [Planctomycetota bacterium]
MRQRPAFSRVSLVRSAAALFAAAAVVACLAPAARAADPPASRAEAAAAQAAAAGNLAERLGASRGIVVLLEDENCRQALDLARATDLIIYVQFSSAADADAAARAVEAAGFLGSRIYVEHGRPSRLHLADNTADAVRAPAGPAGAPKDEILRVLRPQGKAIIGRGEEWTKPFPPGVDDWTHHYHGPDNNPLSADRAARAPYLTQFIAEPRYAPAPQAVVASAGRLFLALGHVAWHQREEPWLNTLVALSGYNGSLLWKRPLTPGIMVDRSTIIATPDTLYLADDESCKLLDPATGRVMGELKAPADQTEGPFWKWMALDGGTLLALVGKPDPLDPDARWKSTNHGWPWTGISQGYNKSEYEWGFAKDLLALDPKTGKVLWRHHEDEPMDSRALALKAGRVYVASFGKYLAALDAATGRELWRRTAQRDRDLFEAIGPYRPGHGYVGGWKSTVYLKCTEKALYLVGPQVNWVTAVSADDGRLMWTYPVKDMQVVIRDDGLYAIGPQNQTGQSKRLDPMTGSVLAAFDVSRRACTRTTGTADGVFFRAFEGTARLDVATAQMQWMTPMRPQCHVGVIAASGHLYWSPWACDCNLQMFGAIALAPAGNFKFDAAATDAERLEAPDRAAEVAPVAESPADWPAYRADVRRTARSAAEVPGKVSRQWEFAPKQPFEPTAPVAAGGLVFFGGSDGIVRSLDAGTGRPRWTAITGGAIRYPPAIAAGRALVGSGDGWAYALETATGRRLWRFRASPLPRKICVYGALLDTWPVAAGVLVDGGTAYLAAGINNFDGTHVYALDAATGRLKWQNNTSGHLDPWSRRGVAVQGEMLLDGGKLYLAGGDAVSPAVFDAATGTCLSPAPTARGSQAPRGRELALADGTVTVSGQPLYSDPASPVYDKGVQWDPQAVTAAGARLTLVEGKGAAGRTWSLVARDEGGKELWSEPLPGEPVRWGICVDRAGRIIVTLRGGRVVCYGK